MIRIVGIVFSVIMLIGCSSPKAGFNYMQKDAVAPANVQFENTSSKAETYKWDFGDGKMSTEVTPDHRYVLSGKYTVKLVAMKGGKESVVEQEIIFEAPEACLLEMETTMGTMTIQLYDVTPKHRDNFITLAEEGYYDGLLFHRVIYGFMAQGGDPNSKDAKPKAGLGSGGPGYQVDAEFNAKYVHTKGALAAARTGGSGNPKKKSSGSQFYIVHGKKVSEGQLNQLEVQKGIKYTEEQRAAYTEQGGTPFLDMEYTVYGMVVKGLDVVDAIAEVKTGKSDRPLEDVKIKSVRVIK
jgi:cyclophilin family peptidyl-prolyl cis-trans isomerase